MPTSPEIPRNTSKEDEEEEEEFIQPNQQFNFLAD